MKTIAISRLIGSEGAKIARRVTEALGYTLVNKSVLEGIFRQYGAGPDMRIMNIKLRRFAFPSIASLALLASCDRSVQTPPAAATPSPTPAAAPAAPAAPATTPAPLDPPAP